MPKLPVLETAINTTIDKLFALVEEDPDKVSSWEKFRQIVGGHEDRPAAAVMALGDGLDQAGMTVPVPDGVKLIYGRYIPVPFFDDIDIPTDYELTWSDERVTDAIGSYVGFVKSVKNTIETVKDVIDKVKYIAFPLAEGLKWLIRKLEDMIKKQLEQLKQEIKHELALLIVRMVDSITGVKVDDEAHRTIGDALQDLHERIEDFEHQTSLQARLLKDGDLAKLTKEELEPIVGPVDPAPDGGWIAKNPLPPSHSEIAKDHAAALKKLQAHDPGNPIRDAIGGALHQLGKPDTKPLDPAAQAAGAGVRHDDEAGSIFYGLARALAIEADRHVLRQVELMWASQGTLYGDKGDLDKSKEEVGHEAFSKEAAGRAQTEEKRSAHAGFKFAQSDAANAALVARPEVRDLLNLVDLIVSHPDDSSWWRTVFDIYIAAHPVEVAQHIRERNTTRGARTTVAP
jgi:hypothetical protein